MCTGEADKGGRRLNERKCDIKLTTVEAVQSNLAL